MTKRVQAARANGSLGGKVSSRNLTDEQREARARNAGLATLNNFGREYFSFLGHRPKPKQKKQEIPIQPKLSAAAKRLAAMR